MTESILGARGHACPVACYISNVIQWHKEFPSYYLVSSTRFFQPFSLVFLLCQQFFSVSVDSSQFFCLAFRWFSFAFFNSILALLESQGPTLSTSNPPPNTSVSTSSSPLLSPASVSISAEALSQAIS